MDRHGVRKFIFSSSASMYSPEDDLLVHEGSAVDPQSPYSASKWLLERILEDTAATGKLNVISLRYFNPIGADPKLRSGLQILHPTHALGKMIEAHKEGKPFTVTVDNSTGNLKTIWEKVFTRRRSQSWCPVAHLR